MNILRNLVPVTVFLGVLAVATTSFQADAFPKFAKKEGKGCNYCHSVKVGGGPRGFRGMYYSGHAFSFKNFDEKKESTKAGVKMNAMGEDSKPTKPYKGK